MKQNCDKKYVTPAGLLKKRAYEAPEMCPVTLDSGSFCVVTVSVVDHSKVQSTSQKTGTDVDFSGSEFNHVWDSGD